MNKLRSLCSGLMLLLSIALLGACGGPDVAPLSLPGPYGGGAGGGTLSAANNGMSWDIAAYDWAEWTFTATKTVHLISLTATGSDLSWDTYDTAFTTSTGQCDNVNSTVPADEVCYTNAPTFGGGLTLAIGTDYGLEVDEWDSVAGQYTLTIDF